MMQRWILLLMLNSGVVFVNGQDTILQMDGTKITAKILEITKEEIKYKKASNLEGPTYILSIADLSKITYENGSVESYNQAKEEEYVATTFDISKLNLEDEKTVDYINSIASNAGTIILSRCAGSSPENVSTQVYFDQVYYDKLTKEAVVPIIVSWNNVLFHDTRRWVKGSLRLSQGGQILWNYLDRSSVSVGSCAKNLREIK